VAEDDTTSRSELLRLTAEIVSSHIANNAVPQREVPQLIQSVFDKLSALAAGETAPAELVPAVPIRRSVTDDYIVCLEDGFKAKMLKRHLMTAHDMTPDAYRARWGLKPDYPLVAPSYARTRRDLAKKSGLGRKPRTNPTEAAPASRTKRPRKKPGS
jgi:predicted transcriptional regulator